VTDSELIAIRDDETQYWIKGAAPGAIWNYIPRRLIVAASLHSSNDQLLCMRIQPTGSPELQAHFAAEAEPEVRRLVAALQA
jgi:hypothetical protein